MSEALKEWQKQTPYKGPDDWVFASEVSFGNPLWPGTLWRRNIGPAIGRAKVDKPKLGWHSLRRSHASLALSPLVGASLRTVMEMMRHASPQMTLGTPEHQRRQSRGQQPNR
jgi:integrase